MELSKNDVVVIKQALNLEPAEFIEAIKKKDVVKISKDYKSAYESYVEFEKSFGENEFDVLSYEDFMKELRKGYGKSGSVQIARLFELSDGIYYDNNYVA